MTSTKKKGSSDRAAPVNTKANTKNVTALFIYGLLLLLVAGGAIAYYIDLEHKKEVQHQKELELAKIQKQKEAEEKKRAELQTLFDKYLNDFKDELRQKASQYKKTRLVLKDMISPYNFENEKFAKENYGVFKREIAPSLRIQASEIIESFVLYQDKIENDLKDETGDIQETFLQKWMDMQQEQLAQYVTFFSREEDLIQAYDDLITFYYTHSKMYQIDMDENKFIFKRPADGARQKELIQQIETLKKKQR